MTQSCAIMQPTYWPWLGYFDLIDQVDQFVLLDTVQCVKRSWMVRNRIRRGDQEQWLTIPIQKTHHRDEFMLTHAQVDDSQPWRQDHLKQLWHAYKKSPHFDSVYPVAEACLTHPSPMLTDLHHHLITTMAAHMGIDTVITMASRLSETHQPREGRLIELCQHLGCDHYLSARGSAAYIESNPQYPQPGGAFTAQGIALTYHHYDHPTYPQRGAGFMPYLGLIDLLMHVGFEEALGVIRSGRQPSFSPESLHASTTMILNPVGTTDSTMMELSPWS